MERMTTEEMLALNVGDLVCDRREKHLRVTHIKENTLPRNFPEKLAWRYLPHRVALYVFNRWPARYIFDKDLTLEDGTRCSAKYECLAVPHDWRHSGQEPHEQKNEPAP